MPFSWRRKMETVKAAAEVVRRGFFTSNADLGGRPQRRYHEAAKELFANEIKRAPLATANAMDDSAGCNTIKAGYLLNDYGMMNDALLGFFMRQGFIGYQIAALLAQHWLIAKACLVPARDAIRQGFEIVTEEKDETKDAEIIRRLRKIDKRMKLNAQCVEFIAKGRIYGVRIAFCRVRSTDPNFYEVPFNPDSITPGSYEGIVQVDPTWITPIMDTMAASQPGEPGFYQPTWWNINGKKYHRSHLIIYRHGPPLPDMLKPLYQYGGIPLPQLIVERVYAAERTANEAPQLAMTKRATVFGTDVAEAMANKEQFDQRLADWVYYRDNYGVKVIDKQEDQLEQIDTSLTDLDDVIMTQYQLVASVAEMPATKLLGTTPKGFNSTGEYDESSYHEMLESLQEHDLTPLIERHHLCAMRAFNIGTVETSINWEPLDSPTAKEYAEINKTEAETDKSLVDAGAIDGADIRDRIRKDKNSGYYGIDPTVPEPPELPPTMTVNEPGVIAQEPTGQDAADTVQYVSNQRYLDETIVAEKMAARDFTVQVSPLFVRADGQRYRIIIDGHHSLEAAKRASAPPVFVEGDYAGSDYQALCEV